ncbi:MAG: nucleoside kinase [Rikenellaceae bacterium]
MQSNTQNLIKIYCENTSSYIDAERGSTLLEILEQLNLTSNHRFIASCVNNKFRDLNFAMYERRSVRFIDQTHFEGYRVYARTLFFILYKVISDLYPQSTLKINYSIGVGYYFEITNIEHNKLSISDIKSAMREIINKDIRILRDRYEQKDVIEIYSKNNLHDKLSIIETHKCFYYTINKLDDKYGYFYGTLAPSTSYVNTFDIKPLKNGFYLCMPQRIKPNDIHEVIKYDQLFRVFEDHKKWNEIIKVSTLGELNKRILLGESNQLIQIAETFQINIFYKVAREIYSKINDGLKLILIAGPSSSGKTTSSKKLNVQLQIFGLKPVVIAMDDYFINREDTPMDEKGNRNYETINTVDIKTFNDNLNRLIAGETVEMPKFDFVKGQRYYDGTFLKLEQNSVIIVEGIHALNPLLTPGIDSKHKYKIYVSALTSLSMDNLTFINTTDNRLLRRIVRDNAYRGSSALDTIKRWGSVRRGEEENIFPFQEEADFMINTALFYEINVLKRYVEPLLLEVPETEHAYAEARRLLKLLKFFTPMCEDNVPHTSILREFIGGSVF